MGMEVVILQATTPFKKRFSNYLLVDLLDVKSELGWKLVNVINRAGGVDVFWKYTKNIKKCNNSKLRFLKTIKFDE
jgi:hypothetical protein